MAELTEDALAVRLAKLNAALDKQVSAHRKVHPYYSGRATPPAAITRAGVTKAYRYLMPVSDAPWGSLIVDSVQDRLEVAELMDPKGSDTAVDRVWEALQENHFDSESKLAHNAALVDGRAYVTVWPDKPELPKMTLDSADVMVVQYEEGSRFNRTAALRRWVDDDSGRPYATLYTPDFLYKLQGAKNSSGGPGTQWERRQVLDEPWPLPNVMEQVPVVELGVNRRLCPGVWGEARGEYAHCVGLLDRINMLTFLGLVVAFWMGFPLRAVIGDKILKDDQGNPIAPFQATAESVIQFTNKDVKLEQFEAADRKLLSIYQELAQLAMITKTPRHYFPYEGGLSNISADAIRADEGALYAKIVDHKATLGEGWLEVARLVGKAMDNEAELSPRARIVWRDHESRSLAERASAFSQLAPNMPWQAVVEYSLNVGEDQIQRWADMREKDAMAMVAQAALAGANANGNAAANGAANGKPAPPPEPVKKPAPVPAG